MYKTKKEAERAAKRARGLGFRVLVEPEQWDTKSGWRLVKRGGGFF